MKVLRGIRRNDMQLTELQKQSILKIADFLAERNSEERVFYNRADYRFGWYEDGDSKYHNDFNNDIVDGFEAFYEISSDNERAFCDNSHFFKQVLEKEVGWNSEMSEIWEDFISHLKDYGDFDDAIEYALMRSVVAYEKPDLYSLGELASMLEKFVTDHDEVEHHDIDRILKDICDEYSWWAKSDNYRLKRLIEDYEEAFKELENMLEEDEED